MDTRRVLWPLKAHEMEVRSYLADTAEQEMIFLACVAPLLETKLRAALGSEHPEQVSLLYFCAIMLSRFARVQIYDWCEGPGANVFLNAQYVVFGKWKGRMLFRRASHTGATPCYRSA